MSSRDKIMIAGDRRRPYTPSLFVYILIAIAYYLLPITLQAQTKAMWVTPWDMNTYQKVINVIEHATEWGITDLLVEVRYRGDALYVPNRTYKDFPNPEPISYLLNYNPHFDALETFVQNTKGTNIRIHAWVTVNVVTTRRLETISYNHLYFTHPGWMTHHLSGRRIRFSQFEGAFLDPGVPEVKDYLVHVFSDIVQNYDIDGLHLDYIRYPHLDYGYNPTSVERFNRLKNQLNIYSFQDWKELQITELVQMIGESTKKLKPELIYTAAVFPNINIARNNYAQNWYEWLDNDLIDDIYIMAYQTRNRDFEQIVIDIPEKYRNRVVVGLRAWSDDGSYRVQSIKDKIALIPQSYAGVCFFSYGGILARSYQSAVTSYVVKQANAIPRAPQTPPATSSPNTTQYFATQPGSPLPNLAQSVFSQPATIEHLLETNILQGEIVQLEIINKQNVYGDWILTDLSENTIANGSLNGVNRVVTLPYALLENRYLILKYVVNDENYVKLIDMRDYSNFRQ